MGMEHLVSSGRKILSRPFDRRFALDQQREMGNSHQFLDSHPQSNKFRREGHWDRKLQAPLGPDFVRLSLLPRLQIRALRHTDQRILHWPPLSSTQRFTILTFRAMVALTSNFACATSSSTMNAIKPRREIAIAAAILVQRAASGSVPTWLPWPASRTARRACSPAAAGTTRLASAPSVSSTCGRSS